MSTTTLTHGSELVPHSKGSEGSSTVALRRPNNSRDDNSSKPSLDVSSRSTDETPSRGNISNLNPGDRNFPRPSMDVSSPSTRGTRLGGSSSDSNNHLIPARRRDVDSGDTKFSKPSSDLSSGSTVGTRLGGGSSDSNNTLTPAERARQYWGSKPKDEVNKPLAKALEESAVSAEEGKACDDFDTETRTTKSIHLPDSSNMCGDAFSEHKNRIFDKMYTDFTKSYGSVTDDVAKYALLKSANECSFVHKYHYSNANSAYDYKGHIDEIWKSASEWAESLHSQGKAFKINGGVERSTRDMDLSALKYSTALMLLDADSKADSNALKVDRQRKVENGVVESVDSGARWNIKRRDKLEGGISCSVIPTIEA